jgi:hypothetical protein
LRAAANGSFKTVISKYHEAAVCRIMRVDAAL